MSVYHWILLSGFALFLISALSMFFIVFLKKESNDPSPARGNVNSAILYSFTGAMSPVKKESAYLHLPTYMAGLIFHLGTFLSFIWLVIFFFNLQFNIWFNYASSLLIFAASFCGIGILIKRIVLSKLRSFSNPDDYISNLLVTGFQFITALTIIMYYSLPLLFIYSTILFLYIPIGKLRHTIYFFTSRIKLGMFYGKRGVWPEKGN